MLRYHPSYDFCAIMYFVKTPLFQYIKHQIFLNDSDISFYVYLTMCRWTISESHINDCQNYPFLHIFTNYL